MIKATFSRDQNGHISSYKITGHAQSGPYGQDIVCAAVSVISIGTINSLQSVAKIQPVVTSNETEGGFLECTVDYQVITDDKTLVAAATLMDSCYQIVNSIVADYADFIQIELLK